MKYCRWIVEGIFFTIIANMYFIDKIIEFSFFKWIGIGLFVLINIVPSIINRNIESKTLRRCANGCDLLVEFVISVSLTIIVFKLQLSGKFGEIEVESIGWFYLYDFLVALLVEAIVFGNGIIRVYTSSTQLGIKYRVIGILCGWIPAVNIFALGMIIRIVNKEVEFEKMVLLRDKKREQEQICKTQYPLLMVHGVFFRDFRYFNYWGRIPNALEKNGACCYYGNQQSAASVEECGKELKDRIEQVLKETGAKKVNIIAHSKGGLDSRYAIAMAGAAPYVASLTTINTPHRGCEFADYLLNKIGDKQQEIVAKTYNITLKKFGDHDPDFLKAVYDLTASKCSTLNEILKDDPSVYYQSVGSKLNKASGGRFPLNLSYHLVNYFDGNNDGLVGEKSFSWGEKFTFLKVKGNRGISHGDMIDLNRENIDDFDVREFYVQLVADLKSKGL